MEMDYILVCNNLVLSLNVLKTAATEKVKIAVSRSPNCRLTHHVQGTRAHVGILAFICTYAY